MRLLRACLKSIVWLQKRLIGQKLPKYSLNRVNIRLIFWRFLSRLLTFSPKTIDSGQALKQLGFTLIELVVVLVVLGILASIATSKYVSLQSDATDASKTAMLDAVRTSWAVALADLNTYPTVTSLTTYVHGASAEAVVSGVRVWIGDSSYIVRTYTNTSCATATTGTNGIVRCISGITP